MKAPQLILCRSESVRPGLSRIVDELVKSAIAYLKQPSADREEDSHQLRLAIKRLRAILRLLRRLEEGTAETMEGLAVLCESALGKARRQ